MVVSSRTLPPEIFEPYRLELLDIQQTRALLEGEIGAALPLEATGWIFAKTQGNPLAAGLIAFGAGLLVSSLIPASQKEREAADALKTAAEPLTTELTEAAKNVAEGLREPAQEAMENVKASAADATEHGLYDQENAVGALDKGLR